MRLFEIMSERVETIDPAEAADVAWERLRRGLFHHLVVTEANRVIGVVSDGDLGGPHGEVVRQGRTVRELMGRKLVTATPETSVREAANLLRGYVIGCLPILQKKRLVGIITTTDLLDLLGRGVERPIRAPKRSTMKPKKKSSRSAA